MADNLPYEIGNPLNISFLPVEGSTPKSIVQEKVESLAETKERKLLELADRAMVPTEELDTFTGKAKQLFHGIVGGAEDILSRIYDAPKNIEQGFNQKYLEPESQAVFNQATQAANNLQNLKRQLVANPNNTNLIFNIEAEAIKLRDAENWLSQPANTKKAIATRDMYNPLTRKEALQNVINTEKEYSGLTEFTDSLREVRSTRVNPFATNILKNSIAKSSQEVSSDFKQGDITSGIGSLVKGYLNAVTEDPFGASVVFSESLLQSLSAANPITAAMTYIPLYTTTKQDIYKEFQKEHGGLLPNDAERSIIDNAAMLSVGSEFIGDALVANAVPVVRDLLKRGYNVLPDKVKVDLTNKYLGSRTLGSEAGIVAAIPISEGLQGATQEALEQYGAKQGSSPVDTQQVIESGLLEAVAASPFGAARAISSPANIAGEASKGKALEASKTAIEAFKQTEGYQGIGEPTTDPLEAFRASEKVFRDEASTPEQKEEAFNQAVSALVSTPQFNSSAIAKGLLKYNETLGIELNQDVSKVLNQLATKQPDAIDKGESLVAKGIKKASDAISTFKNIGTEKMLSDEGIKANPEAAIDTFLDKLSKAKEDDTEYKALRKQWVDVIKKIIQATPKDKLDKIEAKANKVTETFIDLKRRITVPDTDKAVSSIVSATKREDVEPTIRAVLGSMDLNNNDLTDNHLDQLIESKILSKEEQDYVRKFKELRDLSSDQVSINIKDISRKADNNDYKSLKDHLTAITEAIENGEDKKADILIGRLDFFDNNYAGKYVYAKKAFEKAIENKTIETSAQIDPDAKPLKWDGTNPEGINGAKKLFNNIKNDRELIGASLEFAKSKFKNAFNRDASPGTLEGLMVKQLEKDGNFEEEATEPSKTVSEESSTDKVAPSTPTPTESNVGAPKKPTEASTPPDQGTTPTGDKQAPIEDSGKPEGTLKVGSGETDTSIAPSNIKRVTNVIRNLFKLNDYQDRIVITETLEEALKKAGLSSITSDLLLSQKSERLGLKGKGMLEQWFLYFEDKLTKDTLNKLFNLKTKDKKVIEDKLDTIAADQLDELNDTWGSLQLSNHTKATDKTFISEAYIAYINKSLPRWEEAYYSGAFLEPKIQDFLSTLPPKNRESAIQQFAYKLYLDRWQAFQTITKQVIASGVYDIFTQVYVLASITKQLQQDIAYIPDFKLNMLESAIKDINSQTTANNADFLKKYKESVQRSDPGKFIKEPTGGTWIKYVKGDEEYLTSRSLSSWCTSRGMSAHYLAKGDFWVYVDSKGKTKLALQMDRDSVGQVQNVTNSAKISKEEKEFFVWLKDSGELNKEQQINLEKHLEHSVASITNTKLGKTRKLSNIVFNYDRTRKDDPVYFADILSQLGIPNELTADGITIHEDVVTTREKADSIYQLLFSQNEEPTFDWRINDFVYGPSFSTDLAQHIGHINGSLSIEVIRQTVESLPNLKTVSKNIFYPNTTYYLRNVITNSFPNILFSKQQYKQFLDIADNSEIPNQESSFEDDIPFSKEESGKVQAFVYKDKTYIVAGNIDKGKELGVILHEIGVHLGMKGLIGEGKYLELTKQVQGWLNSTNNKLENQIAKEAHRRVVQAGLTETNTNYLDELLAYFVEVGIERGLASDLNKGLVSTWLNNVIKLITEAVTKILNIKSLTPKQVVQLAHAAALNVLQSNLVEGIKTGSIVKYNNKYYFVRKVNADSKVQLTNEEGVNLPGTPFIGKVTLISNLPSKTYNNTTYYYSRKTDTLYTSNGVAWKDKSSSESLKIKGLFKPSTSNKTVSKGESLNLTGYHYSQSGTIDPSLKTNKEEGGLFFFEKRKSAERLQEFLNAGAPDDKGKIFEGKLQLKNAKILPSGLDLEELITEVSKAKQEGYDGIVAPNVTEMGAGEDTQYAIFDTSTQDIQPIKDLDKTLRQEAERLYSEVISKNPGFNKHPDSVSDSNLPAYIEALRKNLKPKTTTTTTTEIENVDILAKSKELLGTFLNANKGNVKPDLLAKAKEVLSKGFGFAFKDTPILSNPDTYKNFITSLGNVGKDVHTSITNLVDSLDKSAGTFVKLPQNDPSIFLMSNPNKAGIPTFDPRVSKAIAIASYSFIATQAGSLSFNTEYSLKSMLGWDNKGDLPDNAWVLTDKGININKLADQLGRLAYKMIGLKRKESTNDIDKKRLEHALGLWATKALLDTGYVQQNQIPLNFYNSLRNLTNVGDGEVDNKASVLNFIQAKTVVNKSGVVELAGEAARVTKLFKDNPNILKTINSTFELDLKEIKPIVEPITKIPKFIADTTQELTDIAKETLGVIQQRPWEFNTPVFDIFSKIVEGDEKEFLALLGYFSKPEEGQEFFLEGRQGKNRALKQSLNNLMEFKKQLDTLGSKVFYLPYFISKTNRVFVDGSTGVNPQTDKITRFLVNPSKELVTNFNNESEVAAFKVAAMSAFGFEIGKKKTEEEFIQGYEALLQELNNKGITKKSVETNPNLAFTFLKEKMNAKVVEEFSHGLTNLYGILSFEADRSTGKESTNALVLIELDGKTNGTAWSIAQTAALTANPEVRARLLNSVGIFTDSNIRSYSEYMNTPGTMDLYQTVASIWGDNLLDTRPMFKPIVTAFGYFVGNIIENSEVTKLGRELAKDPVMKIVFGQGMTSLKKEVTNVLIKSIYTKIESIGKSTKDFRELNSQLQSLVFPRSLKNSLKAITVANWKTYRLSENVIKHFNNSKDMSSIVSTYGSALEGAINRVFAPLLAIRTHVNNIFNFNAAAFLTILDKKKDTLLKGREVQQLTEQELRKLFGEAPLINSLPSYKLIYSNADNVSQGYLGLGDKSLRNPDVGVQVTYDKQQSITPKNLNGRDVTPTTSHSGGILETTFQEPGVAGFVANIHSNDGSNMQKVLLEHNALGVHDAIVADHLTIHETGKTLNKTFSDINVEHSLLESVLDTYKRIVKIVSDNQIEVPFDLDINISESLRAIESALQAQKSFWRDTPYIKVLQFPKQGSGWVIDNTKKQAYSEDTVTESTPIQEPTDQSFQEASEEAIEAENSRGDTNTSPTTQTTPVEAVEASESASTTTTLEDIKGIQQNIATLNKGRVVTIQYQGKPFSFKATVTGEIKETTTGYYELTFRTNTGKIVTANPLFEVTLKNGNKLEGIDILTEAYDSTSLKVIQSLSTDKVEQTVKSAKCKSTK